MGMSTPFKPGDKPKPTALAIFVLPECLLGSEAEEREGEPMEVKWWINNFNFSHNEDPKWQSTYEKLMATWLGKVVTPERSAGFILGRELGTGPEDWNPSLKEKKLKKQFKKKPGIPIGASCLLRVVHSLKKSGKTYAELAPPYAPENKALPGSKEYKEHLAMQAAWLPGLRPADDKARSYGVPESYVKYNDRKKSDEQQQGSSSQQPSSVGQFPDEPEDDDSIPF